MLVVAPPARAESSGVIVLAVSPPSAPLEVRDRTEDELRAAGFEVVEAGPHDATEGMSSLVALAADRDALALVVLEAPSVASARTGEWTIVVVDRVTGKRTERRFAGGPHPAADRIALLSVELLYASLLELEAAHSVQSQGVAPAPVTRELRRRLREPPSPPRWRLRLGAKLLGSPGRAGMLPAASVGIAAWPSALFGIDVNVSPSLATLRLDEGGSHASLWFGSGAVHAMVAPLRGRAVGLAMGLGGGVLLAQSTGRGRAPLEGASEWTTVGVASTAAMLGWRVTPRLRLSTAVEAGLTFPELRVRFAGHEVASAGRPLIAGFAGLEWTWGAAPGARRRGGP